MATLYEELRKIRRQLVGPTKLFGYKSTEANQLYLLYCLCGKIFFTGKLHQRIKFLWFVCVLFEIITAFSIGYAYTFYFAKFHFIMHLYVFTILGTCIAMAIGLPLVTFRYSDSIEKMIESVDQYMWNKPRNVRVTDLNAKIKRYVHLLVFLYLCDIGQFYVYMLDAIFFFDSRKFTDATYYTLPLPGIEQYGCVSFFLASNTLMNAMMAFVMFQLFSMMAFLVFWYYLCYTELAALRGDIEAKPQNFNVPKRWNALIKKSLSQETIAYLHIIRIVDLLEGYYDAITVVAIPTSSIHPIALVYLVASTDMDPLLRFKAVAISINIWCFVFAICWMGHSLGSLVKNIRNMVTPSV